MYEQYRRVVTRTEERFLCKKSLNKVVIKPIQEDFHRIKIRPELRKLLGSLYKTDMSP